MDEERHMDAACTSIFLVGRAWHARSEKASERAAKPAIGLDRDGNGWRRVDVSLMYMWAVERTQPS